MIEQNGYLLESTKKFPEYLTKAYYSIPQNENQQLILNIDNKGSKDNFAVGNIRIENLNGADENIIKKYLPDYLKKLSIYISNKTLGIFVLNPLFIFLLKPFYHYIQVENIFIDSRATCKFKPNQVANFIFQLS